MKKCIQIVVGACLSSAFVFPLVLAGTTSILEAAFVSLITLAVYIHQICYKAGSFIAFQIALIFGMFFSIAFILLDFIDDVYNIRDDFFFLGTFVVAFAILTWLTFIIKKHEWRTIFFSILNALSICSIVLLIIFVKNLSDHLAWVLTMGFLMGIVFGSVGGILFQFYLDVVSKIFTKVIDYIEVLFKPFLIYFIGYTILALIFTGIYYLLLLHDPSSLSIPEEQPIFLNLLVYSFDTMSTGGDSRVSTVSIGAQTVNAFNVYTSIIWMTIMLAATISYSSEKFEEIKKLHRKRKAA